jgi:hypothetical protein
MFYQLTRHISVNSSQRAESEFTRHLFDTLDSKRIVRLRIQYPIVFASIGHVFLANQIDLFEQSVLLVGQQYLTSSSETRHGC